MVSVANEESDEGPATFFVYTGVGTQSVVFKRKWEEISPPEQEENDESAMDYESNSFVNKLHLRKYYSQVGHM